MKGFWKKTITLKLLMLILLLSLAVNGAVLLNLFSVPNQFSPGEVISSSKINGNFSAIENEINQLRRTRVESVVLGKIQTGFTHDYGTSTSVYAEFNRCESSSSTGSESIYYSCFSAQFPQGNCIPQEHNLYETYNPGEFQCYFDDLNNGNLQAGSDPKCIEKSACNRSWDNYGGSARCELESSTTAPYSSYNSTLNYSNCSVDGVTGYTVCDISSESSYGSFDGGTACQYDDIDSGTGATGGVYCKDAALDCDAWEIESESISYIGPEISLSGISWNLELNKNSSFDPSTGVFTVPENGQYGFVLNLVMVREAAALSTIYNSTYKILVNGVEMGLFAGSRGRVANGQILGLGVFGSGYIEGTYGAPSEIKLNLNAGDEVSFKINCGSTHSNYLGSFANSYDCILGGEISEKTSYLQVNRY